MKICLTFGGLSRFGGNTWVPHTQRILGSLYFCIGVFLKDVRTSRGQVGNTFNELAIGYSRFTGE